MNNISEIQLGGLYHIPHYWMAMYDYVDAKQHNSTLSNGPVLGADVPFVPLEIHTVKLQYYKHVVHRVKILTAKAQIGWLSLEESELPYVFPMTSCDKQL
jgi:hypothetical protein